MNELGRIIVISGFGSPIGFVSANANTIYCDLAGISGVNFWYKATENDVNGWIPWGSNFSQSPPNCLSLDSGQPLLLDDGNYLLLF